MTEFCLDLSFYGNGVRVTSKEKEILEAIEHDFSYFSLPVDKCRLLIECRREKPNYENLPMLLATSATPRNICFKGERETYIDYFGKALNIYSKEKNSCQIIAEDVDMIRTIAYLTILSRISEMLDQQGIHRIHALGLDHGGRGILVMLPVGGGKTTLAMSILADRDNNIRLISEDSPLIRRDGTLLPFPLSIAVLAQNLPAGIDEKYARRDKRLETESKIRIDIRYFADKIAKEAVPPGFVLLGRRSTGDVAEISRAPRSAVIKHSLMNSIIGVGLYQGMEFIMQKNAVEVAGQVRILLSRLYNNVRLFGKSQIFFFTMGRNTAKNYQVLRDFLAGKISV